MLQRLKTIFGLETRSTLANPSPEMFALFGAQPTASGAAVTATSAMRCTSVYASVKVLSESVAQLPLILYRRTEGGGKERATDHPLYPILHDLANPWTSSFDFRQFMQAALCLHGNCFAFINRTNGRIAELIAIDPHAVTVETDETTMEPRYRVAGRNGASRVYQRSEIFHLKTLGTDPNIGLSPVGQAREAIGLAMTMEQHAARLFANGARPSGILSYAKSLGKEAMDRLRDSFSKAQSGSENSGKTLILEDGMTWTANQFSSVDSQFLELRRYQIAEIARVFRVPLSLLQDLERVTHNNAESMGRQFLSLTLMPWLKAWEGAIHRSLLSPEERATYYAEFLPDDLARADFAARFEAYAKAITNGVLNPNEARAAENRPPYDGGEQFRLPMNTESATAPGGSENED